MRGTGVYLVLSPAFLRKLSAGGDSFLEGCGRLEEALEQLTGSARGAIGVGAYLDEEGVSYWTAVPQGLQEMGSRTPQKTLFDWMREAQEKAKSRKKLFQVAASSSLYQSPMQTYARLSRARTEADVKNVLATAQQTVYQLKVAASLGDDSQKEKARAVLAQMQRAVIRGRRKIQDLGEERTIQQRQKRAERQMEQRRALHLALERRRRQSARHARESAAMNEATLWAYQQAEADRQKLEAQLRAEAAISVSDPSAGAAVSAEAAAAGGGGGAAMTAADVTVVTASTDVMA